MRTVLVLGGLVVATASAAAKPARANRIEMDEPPEPCLTGKSWSDVTTCLAGTGVVSDVYSTADVHVVHVQSRVEVNRIGRVLVYHPSGSTGWSRVSLYMMTGTSSELLGAAPFETPSGRGVQIRVGQTLRMLVSLDGQLSRTQALVKREQSAVCVPGANGCSLMFTRCTAYIDGKAYWSFEGQLVWHPTLGVRMRGSTQLAGGACLVSPSLLVDGEGP